MRPATTAIITVTTLLVLILLQTDIAAARPLTIEDLFAPFEYLHIEDIYDRYSALIDFFIFTLIFVGLAQATLGQRYPGPARRAVAIGVGLSLAISLLIAETTWNFNLKTLGPLAATIILLILGVMIYQFLHTAGMTRTAAAGTAYLTAFFGITAAAPGLFDWLNTTIPTLSAVAVLGILAALLALLSGLHVHPGTFSALASRWAATQKNSPRRQRRVNQLSQETQYIKRGAKPAINNEIRKEQRLETGLRVLRNTLKRRGAEPGAQQFILQDLERITAQAETILEDIQRVWELNTRLREFDRELFHEDYIREVEAMSPQEQTSLKQDIQQQLQKIAAEKRLQEIQAQGAKYLQSLRACMAEAAEAIKERIAPGAVAAIERAIHAAQAIGALARQTKTLEKALLRITKRQKGTTP